VGHSYGEAPDDLDSASAMESSSFILKGGSEGRPTNFDCSVLSCDLIFNLKFGSRASKVPLKELCPYIKLKIEIRHIDVQISSTFRACGPYMHCCSPSFQMRALGCFVVMASDCQCFDNWR